MFEDVIRLKLVNWALCTARRILRQGNVYTPSALAWPRIQWDSNTVVERTINVLLVNALEPDRYSAGIPQDLAWEGVFHVPCYCSQKYSEDRKKRTNTIRLQVRLDTKILWMLCQAKPFLAA